MSRSRIRSYNYLLEYNTSIEVGLLKDELFKSLNFEILGRFEYLFVTESNATGQSFIVVLLSFSKKMDFYKAKFEITTGDTHIVGTYQPVSDLSITLRYLLKGVKFDNILTNIEDAKLMKHHRLSFPISLAKSSTSNFKKITPKQSARILEFISSAETELGEETPNLFVLNKLNKNHIMGL